MEKKYRGEILCERRRNLDFKKDIGHIAGGLSAGLPEYPLKERIEHYNKRLKQTFEEIKKGR